MSIGPIDLQPFIAKPTHTEQMQPAETHSVQQAHQAEKLDQEEAAKANQITNFNESNQPQNVSEEEKKIKRKAEEKKQKSKKQNQLFKKKPADALNLENLNQDEITGDDKGRFFDFKA